jgi:hypothetical protein
MKRCPLCEFIYEDDQSVCDMDGIELVLINGALVPVGKETTLRPPRDRVLRRRRSLHLLLAFGLGAAAFSAYYTSVNQAAPAGDASASYAHTPIPAVEPTPAPSTPAPATTPAETPASHTAVAKPKPAASAPPARPRPQRSREPPVPAGRAPGR